MSPRKKVPKLSAEEAQLQTAAMRFAAIHRIADAAPASKADATVFLRIAARDFVAAEARKE